jgi:hypothetical protein
VDRYGELRALVDDWVARYRALGEREALNVTWR